MNTNKPRFTAIGLTYSNKTLHVLMEVLGDPKFDFVGAGTMASGYELCVAPAAVDEAIREIKTNTLLKHHKIDFYKCFQDVNERTRYDRLIDHLEGENPSRPSVNGIRIDLE